MDYSTGYTSLIPRPRTEEELAAHHTTRRKAAVYACGEAADRDEAEMFLDMLGLLDPSLRVAS